MELVVGGIQMGGVCTKIITIEAKNMESAVGGGQMINFCTKIIGITENTRLKNKKFCWETAVRQLTLMVLLGKH